MRTAVLALGLAAFGTSANAAVIIDFQSLEQLGDAFFNVGTSYSEDGFTFTQGPAEPFQLAVFGNAESRYPGSTALFNNTVGGSITLTKDGGGLFSISSIDLANLNSQTDVSVTFTGTYADLTTTQQIFNFNSFQALSTFAFNPSFSGLTSLRWTQDSPFHQFDNVTLDGDEVPEPTSLLLVGMAVAGAALRRRRAR
jgi:hypothetical protein